MKNIKSILLIIATSMVSLVYAQTTDSTATSSMQNAGDSPAGNIAGWVIGGVAVIALIVVLILMVRNRRKTLGGIQNQSKPAPTVVTPESIDNPGSGV